MKTFNRTLVLLSVVLVMFALSLAACTPKAAPEPTPAPPAQEQQTPADPPTPPPANDQTPPAAQDNAAAMELQSMFSNQEGVEFMVTYTLTSNVQGTAIDGTMSEWVKGTKIRMDSAAMGSETRSYVTDGAVTFCNKPTGSWMCFEQEVTPDESTTAKETLKDNTLDYTIVKIANRQIAGTTASCYAISDVEGYDMEYCFSPEYVPLYISVTGDEYASTMTATAYATTVTDADFVPPAEPSEMPQIPNI